MDDTAVGAVTPLLPTNADKLKAIRDLSKWHHLILTRDCVKEYAVLFGCSDETYQINKEYLHDPSNPDRQGLCAAALAARICRHLKVKYEWKSGIGSSLRECCNKLIQHLENTGKSLLV